MLGVGIIGLLVVGLIAGWIANKIAHGGGQGLLANLVTGVIGAFVGGILFWLLGLRATGFIGALVIATVGAVVFLWVRDRYARRS
jgi:uncharacterized membrane protein YeaQ/YmgE (transglycosylase-associated protein family)